MFSPADRGVDDGKGDGRQQGFVAWVVFWVDHSEARLTNATVKCFLSGSLEGTRVQSTINDQCNRDNGHDGHVHDQVVLGVDSTMKM